MPRWTQTPDERFWSQVNRTATCWLWTGTPGPCGYGRTYLHGGRVAAHRRMWELTRGPIPDGLCVCHTCDVRLCVNPDHLWLGTNADNVADRDRKGRQYDRHGERNGRAKLTMEAITVIRNTPKRWGNFAALMGQYGISRSAVTKIRRGEAWVHVGK